MKKENLVNAMGQIDDKYIQEAHDGATVKKSWFSFLNLKRIGVAVVGLCVLLMIIPAMQRTASYDTAAGSYNYTGGSYTTSSKSEMYDGEYLTEAATASEESFDYSGVNTSGNLADQSAMADRKLIVTANVNMETKEFEETIATLESEIKAYGGYLQSSSVSDYYNGRTYEATIRIPSDKYEEFANRTKEVGNVTYYSQSVEDITQEYTDLEAKISSLEAEEARVKQFYDQAENLTELMEVEQRLTEIRYQIDQLSSRRKNYDLLTSYSTMYLTVRETKVYTEPDRSFGARIRSALSEGWQDFTDGLQDFSVGFVYALPKLVLFGIVIALCVFGYRKFKNRRK